MGNYKFRLSDMIPNAWFYKLRDMRRTRNQKSLTKKKHQPNASSSSSSSITAPQPPHRHLSTERKSYYFTRELNPNTSPARFQEPPRKSSKKKRSSNRNRIVSSTVSAGCSCRATVESVWARPDSTQEEYPNSPLGTSSGNDSLLPEPGSDTFDDMVLLSTSCGCKPHNTANNNTNIDPFDAKFELPPIITKKEPQKIRRSSAKFEERNAYGSLSVKIVKENIIKEERITTPVKRFSNSPGMKLRTNSPRIMSHRKTQSVSRKTASSSSNSSSRRSLSESVAVVKTSEDPHRDFKESMVEMIMENDIRTSKDLEELLACYLSLNSDEYHDMIIKVFKQIWFDVTDVRLN